MVTNRVMLLLNVNSQLTSCYTHKYSAVLD